MWENVKKNEWILDTRLSIFIRFPSTTHRYLISLVIIVFQVHGRLHYWVYLFLFKWNMLSMMMKNEWNSRRTQTRTSIVGKRLHYWLIMVDYQTGHLISLLLEFLDPLSCKIIVLIIHVLIIQDSFHLKILLIDSLADVHKISTLSLKNHHPIQWMGRVLFASVDVL